MNWNEKQFLKINSLVGKNIWLDAFGRAGAEWVIVGMGGWYLSISFILNFGNQLAMWRPLITLALGALVGWGLSNLIALGVEEVRPRLKYPEIKILFWPFSSWKSFPSDHTFGAFLIFFLALVFNFPTAWSLLPLAIWVGWGRVYAGVHYPADIFGGVGLAAIVASVSYIILKFL
jgi:membrane-associated phospholipid phosphatase